jgi:mRNA interferase MazF
VWHLSSTYPGGTYPAPIQGAPIQGALVVSVDDILAGVEGEQVVVVPLSSSRAPSPLRPVVSPSEGLERESAALCRAVRAVTRTRLHRRIGAARAETMKAVEEALALVLGITATSR